MKIHYSIYMACACVALLALSSCFKDEEANTECDITAAWVHAAEPEAMFYQLTDSLVPVLYTATDVRFTVRRKADLTRLAPEFAVTPGATISPESGSEHDFSQGPVEYTVTSEDGQYQRHYLVSFQPVVRTEVDTLCYDFEHTHLDDKSRYHVWSELLEDGTLADSWASGNGGFALTSSSAAPDAFPTAPIESGYEGKGVRLVTRDTGPFGKMVNMRLAAGNLFLGVFDMSVALTKTLQATCFGQPFDRRPKSFSLYYRYQRGAQFQAKNGSIVEGKRDEADAYAVLYLNHDPQGQPFTLHGDDVKTSPQIVARAFVTDLPETREWTYREVNFEYLREIDLDLLESRGYSLAIVFTSSLDGAYFQGAIGSTLDVDKVRLVCESIE